MGNLLFTVEVYTIDSICWSLIEWLKKDSRSSTLFSLDVYTTVAYGYNTVTDSSTLFAYHKLYGGKHESRSSTHKLYY